MFEFHDICLSESESPGLVLLSQKGQWVAAKAKRHERTFLVGAETRNGLRHGFNFQEIPLGIRVPGDNS